MKNGMRYLMLPHLRYSFDAVILNVLQVANSKNREEFIKDLKGKYNGVFAISRTFFSVDVLPYPYVN